MLQVESGPPRAVHLSRHKWPGGFICRPLSPISQIHPRRTCQEPGLKYRGSSRRKREGIELSERKDLRADTLPLSLSLFPSLSLTLSLSLICCLLTGAEASRARRGRGPPSTGLPLSLTHTHTVTLSRSLTLSLALSLAISHMARARHRSGEQPIGTGLNMRTTASQKYAAAPRI